MRGALIQDVKWAAGGGIIPADAGSTGIVQLVSTLTKDHPRGCGEHPIVGGVSNPVLGSSPRMRGAPRCSTVRSYTQRIIPADAGSTRSPVGLTCRPKDHPRGCGEHTVTHLT